jgi:hypothetical protein
MTGAPSPMQPPPDPTVHPAQPPSAHPYAAPAAAAERVRTAKHAIATAVTEEFLSRHPDWLERHGERARTIGIEDAGYHVEFRAGAVEAGAAAPFEDSARWAAGMLAARNITPRFVDENIDQVARHGVTFLAGDVAPVAPLLERIARAGMAAAESLPAAPAAAQALAEPQGLDLSQRLSLHDIRQGQRHAALTIALEALRAGHPLIEVYVAVVQESLYDVREAVSLTRTWSDALPRAA